MGQRHQAFVIAKVQSHGSAEAKYRCIAAYHHQWCYGTLPLRATRRLLILVRQPENAEIIREEVRSIASKYGRPGQEPFIPDIPCPFVALILANSWDIDLTTDKAYLSGQSFRGHLSSANMGCWDGPNDDGITAVDVTDPDNPTYCHISGASSGRRSSRQYLLRYYALPKQDEHGEPVEDRSERHERRLLQQARGDPAILEQIRKGERQFKKSMLSAVADMKGEQLMPQSALAEAWPDEYTVFQRSPPTASKPPKIKPLAETRTEVASLVDMSLRKTIQQCIELVDASALDGLVWLSEKMHIVEECVLEHNPMQDTALPVLSMLLRDITARTHALDFSQYPLIPDQVVSLASDLTSVRSLDLSGYAISDGQLHTIASNTTNIRSLNLSRNDSVTTQGIRQLLVQLPSLQRLILMNCPSVSDADLAGLARKEPHLFRNLDAIMHPLFLQVTFADLDTHVGVVTRRLDNPSHPPVAMSVGIVNSSDFDPYMQGVSLPFVHPPLIVQGFTDLASAAASMEPRGLPMSAGRACEVAFAALPRESGKPWAERTIVVPQPLDLSMLCGTASGWMLFIKLPGWLFRVISGWAFLRCLGPDTHSAAEAEVEDGTTEATIGAVGSEPDTSQPSTFPAGDMEDNDEESEFAEHSAPAPTSQPKLNYELHDLRSFLRVTEEEGYRPVSEEAVVALEAALEKVNWPVLTREDMDKILSGSSETL
ncbi:uncharacterized protein PHACADRAFT_169481 [Phanerochaete carnosa HHB-10118-sp]|uniref:Uncharacterized protein n=1 Tax=Phanerochaete carnosa (strain HHB-10118-sp) TaxID=650164 RepID=K5X819_PHACS|nr:uncharacterized protein PHACADRAFT_169481 [Phanerochaete carnosa HHB-10118-sp]EKM59017.1 hypothetical protein PHACADRAFT_169481 [Phanerochaete carnosa HHB-10118-sp]